MAVYVDSMKAKYGRMIMCHMVADSLDELHGMADIIGVQRKWFQCPPKTTYPHYDISLSKKELAIENGAEQIRLRDSPYHAGKCLIEWCKTHSPEHSEWAMNNHKRLCKLMGRAA